MKLIAVGRLKDGAERDLLTRYQKRLRPKLDLVEVPQAKGAALEQKRREADSLLAACPDNAFIVALDEGGRNLSSTEFAANLQNWTVSGKEICFLIGGAEGLDSAVTHRADLLISFGSMTWPHMLVRVLLAEQIFRAQCINNGHPYHRAGRPD
ncbi:23S rRNA (pseudouridine(1915)-N(3))-methyltransferase RlmH [Aristophania vespae]|uniref:Ribosomal RNA large subunit methyltransferase H n=1 Tax=Aristophania vespae TaxID=2697033 RepID=A0A6P1NCB2_9PROT|nr:23S rRNA (pseudouridine(1915)-N(3))-methyltransferase RlmH [Aristophania vespae]QHI94951.1 23S rRNA (pseudouridine(1915)-N(3))-methyltransferase RlmH [Aristophania vespae]QHI96295.1 23S rRNA (pseudouridine(1915)-N(3))-methyltransferase RlmH [Aristophania vespae]UMM64116.1 Ribosomal RNA large subunit methyltransferase H [Aristophania vespae]